MPRTAHWLRNNGCWTIVALLPACSSAAGRGGSDANSPSDANSLDGVPDDGHISAPIILASGEDYPGDVAVAGDDVFFIDTGGGLGPGSVRRVAKSGGAVVTLAPAQNYPGEIVADGSFVYWTTGAWNDPNGAVVRVARDGGTVETMASGQYYPRGLLLSSGVLFWTIGPQTGPIEVLRRSVNGGSPQHVASGGLSLTVDSVSVYLGTTAGIQKVPIGGSGFETIGALTGPSPGPIDGATDGTNVFWSTGNDPGLIAKVSNAGGTSVALVQSGVLYPRGLVADGGYLYFHAIGSFGGAVKRGVSKVAIAGGPVIPVDTIDAGPAPLGGVAIDDTSVYWTSYGDRTVRRAPK
jgi:hypothetical protein